MTVKMNPSKEKRGSPRIDFRLSVMVRGRQGLKEVRNFGLYGVFIQTEDPSQFKSGDEIYLKMKLPREKKAIQVKARVAHVSEKGVGIEFIDLPPRDAMSMDLCFSLFKHTIPLPGI
jgi:hypothetical protein